MNSIQRKIIIASVSILLILVLLFAYHSGIYEIIFRSKSVREPAIHFLDMGESECYVIECDGRYALINAGDGADGGASVENKLRSFGINQIEFLILCSANSRYIGGAPKLIDNMNVKTLVCAEGMFFDGSMFSKTALSVLKRNNTDIVYVTAGENIKFYDADINFLYLSGGQKAQNYSFSLSVTLENKSFFFAGGMTSLEEKEMLQHVSVPRCDVYVASNNGAVDSNSEELLSALKPSICVVSTANTPKKRFSDRLEKHNIRLFTTQEKGDITFLCRSDKIVSEK